jgi:hypothetical protein
MTAAVVLIQEMFLSGCTRSVRKASGIISFCENLVDFNEPHLREVTLNLNMHA